MTAEGKEGRKGGKGGDCLACLRVRPSAPPLPLQQLRNGTVQTGGINDGGTSPHKKFFLFSRDLSPDLENRPEP